MSGQNSAPGAGVPTEAWAHQGPTHEWLARIARPPAPKIEAAIPEEQHVNLPLPPAAGFDSLGTPQVGTRSFILHHSHLDLNLLPAKCSMCVQVHSIMLY